jgi:hypothetical protein
MLDLNQQNGLVPNTDMNINPSTLPWIGCSEGPQIFETAIVFKKLSALLSPTGKEEVLPAEVVICKKCGLVPKFIWDKMPDFPENMRSTCDNGK